MPSQLAEIAVAAGQIAAICEQVLGQEQGLAEVRLDMLASEVAATAQVRYDGAIDVISRPIVVSASYGDLIRILSNLLSNACRAAGPGGRVRVLIDDADGQALLAIADSGRGLGQMAAGGGSGLGLEIIGELTLKYGGSVQLGVSDLGGLAVTIRLPGSERGSN